MNIRQKALGALFLCLIGLQGILSCSSQDQQESFGAQPASLVHFEVGSSACNIPFRIVDNIMYVTIRINDSIDVLATFDSGLPLNGVLVIDSAAAGRLGLVYVGSVGLGGAGDETAVADIAVGATVSLPGVTFKDQQVLVVRDTKRYEQWLPGAIIGGTMLNSCVVQIDHEKSLLHLYENGSFDSLTAGERFEIAFSQGIPVIEGKLEHKGNQPVRVRLLVDTGADVPFSLHSYEGLGVQPPPDALTCYISEGIKGDVYGQWYRIEAIHIGTFQFDSCLVAYPTAGFDDVITTLGQNGFFGLESQRRFTMTFDYLHSRMFLKANSKYGDPFEFNMAGLVLRTLRNGAWEVMDVVPNSASSLAGIRKGDLIVAVGGRNCSSIEFAEREHMFARMNVPMQLSVNRGETAFDTMLTLRRII